MSASPVLVAQAAPAEGQTTVQTQSTLVVIDVTAADEKHDPIHQLTSADFTILEDGQPQKVKVFEEHLPGVPAPSPRGPKLGPGQFSNLSPVPHGALNILLFDKLNTPLISQGYVREQVLTFLKNAPSGTRIAIFGLTTELKILQGFTSDPNLLRSIVEGNTNRSSPSPLMPSVVNADNPGGDNAELNSDAGRTLGGPDAATLLANLQQFEAQEQAYDLRVRQLYTLNALNQLARYMSNLPGRKNLIWFSGSFPINVLPDNDLQDPFTVQASAEEEFRQTVDMLSRGQIAVYPIDARGLMISPGNSASSQSPIISKGPRTFTNSDEKWTQEIVDEHETMEEMAKQTGGKAFVNSNGLTEAVETAIEVGSNYYTVAYEPANGNWNGGFRRIQVKVDRPGVTLAYRRGYFADDPIKYVKEIPVESNQEQSGKGKDGQHAEPQYNALRAAMTHGSPEPAQIIFVADVRPVGTDNEAAGAEFNKLAKNVKGPFRRYSVTYAINPSQLSFVAGQDGARHFSVEFMSLVYDDSGAPVNEQVNGLAAAILDAKFADSMKHGFVYRQQISVPVKGEYYFRIGVRDRNTDKVGALEIPVRALAKVQPASALVPAGGTQTKPN